MRHFGAKSILMMVLLPLSLSACATGEFGTRYKSYIDPISTPNVIALAEGEKPKLIKSENIEIDKKRYLNMVFVIVGEVDFKKYEQSWSLGKQFDQNEAQALSQAKKVAATHVLYFRKLVDEYSQTTFNKKTETYDYEVFETFHNAAVYMVKNVYN
jgi:hypothetical protein